MRELIILFDAYAIFMWKNEIETYTCALKSLWQSIALRWIKSDLVKAQSSYNSTSLVYVYSTI